MRSKNEPETQAHSSLCKRHAATAVSNLAPSQPKGPWIVAKIETRELPGNVCSKQMRCKAKTDAFGSKIETSRAV